MKIGFIGNANNYPFILARTLKRQGHEIVFIVDSNDILNRPEYVDPDIETPYPDWIHDFSTGVPGTTINTIDLLQPSIFLKDIGGLFDSCDAIIANGLWAIVARQLAKPFFVILTGSDLYVYADKAAANSLAKKGDGTTAGWVARAKRRRITGKIVTQQRLAISEAKGFNFFPPGILPDSDKLIDSISPSGKRTSFLMTDLFDRKVTKLLDTPTPRIFYVARLNWVYPIPAGYGKLDYKGADILINGFAKYIQQGGKMQLDIVKKGLHISETRNLIKELSIEKYVVWHDEMSQTEFLEMVQNTDIIADQFSTSSLGMGALDALAQGRPLLANARSEIFEPILGVKSPICHATTPEMVCKQLHLLSDFSYREKIGKASKEYVRDHFSTENAAQQCLDILRNQPS